MVGGVQLVFELLAYYAGVGPYGYVFEESPYTIGWVEAHGLAFIIGVLLLTVAARDGRRFWHVVAGSVPRCSAGEPSDLNSFVVVRNGVDGHGRNGGGLRDRR